MDAFTLLCHRTFSSQHRLSHQACCPSMDLALLTTPSTGTTENQHCHDTINCLRLSGSTPLVWSVPVNRFFTENDLCLNLVGQPIEIDPSSRYDEIDALHWSPDGQCFVAALSSKSLARPPAFILLSVHSGQLLSSPTLITSDNIQESSHLNSSRPSEQSNKLYFFKWLPLPSPNSVHRQADQKPFEFSSIGQELCDRLPANLTIPQLKNIQTIRHFMGPVYNSNLSSVTGKSSDHYPMIRLPPSLISDPHQPKQRPIASSLLILSSHVNKLHFFLNGTVYLGTTSLPEQAELVSAQIFEHDAPPSAPLDPLHRGGVRLKLMWLGSSNSIGFSTLDLLPSLQPSRPSSIKSSLHLNPLQVEPSLSVIGINSKELNRQVQLSHEIQSLLKDCLFAYFGIVKDWHVAKATGKKWYENFNDLSKAHNVTAPISFQMLELLFLGQSNEGLRDYLGTKSGERTFTKWETTVLGSLTRIRLAIIELLVPAAERLYILATELRLHTYAPFSSTKIIEDDDFETLFLVEALIRYLIKAFHMLDKSVKEEEILFGHFCKWLRSEFDYVIALENSPIPPTRPQMKYDFMAISDFIQRGESSSLDEIIFPRFPIEKDNLKHFQETKEQLSKKFYNEFFDVDGPESRAEMKKKLCALLSSQYPNEAHPRTGEVRDSKNEPTHGQSQANLTPDISQFHKPRPSAKFQTPNLAEHLKRQTNVAITPPNASMYKRPPMSPSHSKFPLSSNLQDSCQFESQHGPNGSSVRRAWGIYTCLTYCSSLMSEVFGNIFSKIAMAKPMHLNSLRSENLLLKPTSRRISSRFVQDIHYAGFLVEMEEGRDVLVIDRMEPLLGSTINPTELQESQVIIDLKLPQSFLDNPDRLDSTAVKVLDFDFFDDFEFVLLVRLDSGLNVRYLIITINFPELFNSPERNLSELPFHRVHQLGSDYQPDQISLNGSQGRRTGCVTSGQGRMIHVFDMEDTST